MTNSTSPLRGFCTVTVFADDVAEAGRWYAGVFSAEPYFARPEEGPPAYVEFRIGDDQDEFGILDRRYGPASAGVGGAIVHWHVDDIDVVFADLLSRGATVYDPISERGPGFVTASVVDPFGNVLGVMYNEHWRSRHDETPTE